MMKIYAAYVKFEKNGQKRPKMRFFIAGWSKITRLINKKLQNNVSFLIWYSCDTKKVSHLRRIWENGQKWPKTAKNAFFSSQGYVKSSAKKIKRCKIVSAFFFIFMSQVKNQPPTQYLRKMVKSVQKLAKFDRIF